MAPPRNAGPAWDRVARLSKPDPDPVELIATADAGSFSLALSNEPELKVSVAGEIVTLATLTLEHLDAGWSIMSLHLNVVARLPK